MQIYGLIGYPVKHSLSAAMHKAAFKHLGIDAEYRLFEVRPEDLRSFFICLEKENISGLNVTIPHKEKVIPFLNSISQEAELIGAVNTVEISGVKLSGFNTDGKGFLRDIGESLGFNPQGKQIAILGAGGAARAVSVYLAKSNPTALSIYDPDAEKLNLLIRHLEKNFKRVKFHAATSVSGLGIKGRDLLVNASPIGMKEGDPPALDKKLLHKGLYVYDLVYNRETQLLRDAKIKCAGACGGLGMFLYQGVLAFEIWTKKDAPVALMRRALEEALKKQ